MTRSGSVKHQRYKDRENIVSKLENEFESMSEVINNYVEMSRNKDFGAGMKYGKKPVNNPGHSLQIRV